MTAGRAEPFGNKTKRRSETKQKGDRPAAESVTAKNETSVFAKTQKRGRSLYGETERNGEIEQTAPNDVIADSRSMAAGRRR